MTMPPLNKLDKRDLCVCEHSWSEHARRGGRCEHDMCRCDGFYRSPSRRSRFSWLARRQQEQQQ